MCNNTPRYAIVTTRSCGRCMVAKNMLKSKGIAFAEVDAGSAEGERMVKVYGVKMAGTIIDLHEQKVIELNEVK